MDTQLNIPSSPSRARLKLKEASVLAEIHAIQHYGEQAITDFFFHFLSQTFVMVAVSIPFSCSDIFQFLQLFLQIVDSIRRRARRVYFRDVALPTSSSSLSQ